MDNDIIDISMDFDNLDNHNNNWGSKTNFGGGIELLMNEKKNDSRGQSSDIDIDDLNNLENELNDLAAETSAPMSNSFESGLFGIKSNYDDKPFVSFNEEPSIRILNEDNENYNKPNLGHSTANTASDSKTWDGYGKFNNIPINPDSRMSSDPKLSKEEVMREKFKYLKKLESLEKKGVELTKKYNMDSNLLEMIGEYEMIMEEKNKQNSIKFQGNMMMAIINGLEFLNNRFDPFDIKLDGWGEQINENMTDYDDIFGEFHDKYNSKIKLHPELKLLFQLGGSAMMVHMSNTMFKSAMPGMDDILRQNPDLMRQFQTAAVNSMASSSPGFSGFMGGLMAGETQQRGTGPPPPMATQGPNGIPPPLNRSGNNMSRPDISMARSSANFDDGISIREKNNQMNLNGFEPPQPSQRSSRRPDMKGPGDISEILSGLKTKTIEINPRKNDVVIKDTIEISPRKNPRKNDVVIEDLNNSSTISIDDLKSIQGEGNIPKRSRRRPKSDKNTVSLDI